MDAHTVSSAQVDADIRRLEIGLRELKVQYDMFFNGALKTQPLELKKRLERIINRYRNASMPKYATRFHFNTLVSRFNSLAELWSKTLRGIEEGGQRNPAAASRHHFRERLLARCRVADPAEHDAEMKLLYDRFREARRRGGKKAPSYEKFVGGVSGQIQRLQNSSGCAEIELRLVVSDDKVQLKARPAR